MEKKRRRRRHAKITFVHLLPLILMGILLVFFLIRKGVPHGGAFGWHPQDVMTNLDRATKHIGSAEIVAVFIAMLIYIYIMPGIADRIERKIKPERESRRKRIPSMHGTLDVWQPKPVRDEDLKVLEDQGGIDTAKAERVG